MEMMAIMGCSFPWIMVELSKTDKPQSVLVNSEVETE